MATNPILLPSLDTNGGWSCLIVCAPKAKAQAVTCVGDELRYFKFLPSSYLRACLFSDLGLPHVGDGICESDRNVGSFFRFGRSVLFRN